jgi:arginine decarboxylase
LKIKITQVFERIGDKMRIAIVSGKAEGPTKLNAFDNALSNAGIGDVNLIKVSSMLSGNAKICDLPKLKAGAMVNCVLSKITSDNHGDEITVVIAVAIGEELGCVVETSGINKDSNDLIKEAEKMVKYMMEKRKVEIKDLIVEYSSTQVKNIASCIASVVYLNEDIKEE